MELDIGPLKRTIFSLQAALAEFARDPTNDLARDGCILRFGRLYEVSHKTLKRFLEATAANPASLDALSFEDLIRTGSERGLLRSAWPRWREYRRARSLTSHV